VEILKSKTGKVQFKCPAMKSMFFKTHSPCDGCPENPLTAPRQAANDGAHTPTNDVGESALQDLLIHSAMLEMNGRVYMVNTLGWHKLQ
jgi:hypothetical protein